MAYIIDRPDPGQQFFNDRMNAIEYIDKIAMRFEGTSQNNVTVHKYLRWIKTEPSYPAFEDFTFSFRNQVFPVLVLRTNEKGRLLNPPPIIEALRKEAARNNLVPCVFPVLDRTGRPFFYGEWNLINPFTGKKVDPIALSSDAPVEVSDWELRNWSVNIVWNYLKGEGYERLSYCDAPEIDPQIWFRDKSGRECWIEVLYALYPKDVNKMTFSYDSWPGQVINHDGYVAQVGFAGAEDMSILYRTEPADVNFRGIEKVYTA